MASEQVAIDRYRRLHGKLGERTAGRALEIGCGVGSFLWLLRGAGWAVEGVEPDPNYAAAGNTAYGVQITAAYYEDCPPQNGSFDLIASFHVLEHVESPRVFLERARRELSGEGILYLEVPSIDFPRAGDLENFFWSAHLQTFSERTLKRLLETVGFAPIASGHANGAVWMLASKSDPRSIASLPNEAKRTLRSARRQHRAHRRFQRATGALVRATPTRFAPKLAQAVSFASRARTSALTEPTLIPRRAGKVAERAAVSARESIQGTVRRMTGRPRIAHFGLHFPGNAGDTVLFPAVRKFLDHAAGPYAWLRRPLRREVTSRDVEQINKSTAGVLIGGGGLFLRDTNPNANSGWQWDCSLENLRALDVPIVVFAVGYNRFRGQPEFEPVFTEHVRELVARSAFFGLRNRGSIAQLRPYLRDADLEKRLTYQPCPTTLLSRIYDVPRVVDSDERRLAVNIAFDRSGLRFGPRRDAILASIARALRRIQLAEWSIDIVSHQREDALILPWLHRERVAYRHVDLAGVAARDVIEYYARAPLTLGMRGHSQMIPFGLGNPIASLISHDKLRYFLDDTGHPEWGVDVQSEDLDTRIVDLVSRIHDQRPRVTAQISSVQDELWRTSVENAAAIARAWEV